MGHLVAIANCLNTHLEQDPELKEKIPAETMNKWTVMVSDKLDKVNAAQKLYLVKSINHYSTGKFWYNFIMLYVNF